MDIQDALQELAEKGLSDTEIGKEIKAAQSIVNRLRTGKHRTTSFARGVAIFNLLEKHRASNGSSVASASDEQSDQASVQKAA